MAPKAYFGGKKIVPGGGDLADVGQPSLVEALEAASGDVGKDLGPDLLRLPGDHRVHAFGRFLAAHGGVDPAHDHGDAQAPEVGGDLIGAVGLRGEGGDADQIRPGQVLVVGHPEILIDDTGLPIPGSETGEHHETQAVSTPDSDSSGCGWSWPC